MISPAPITGITGSDAVFFREFFEEHPNKVNEQLVKLIHSYINLPRRGLPNISPKVQLFIESSPLTCLEVTTVFQDDIAEIDEDSTGYSPKSLVVLFNIGTHFKHKITLNAY